jgi:hypothetical protein
MLPEDVELLARTGSKDNPELEVDIELRQAGLALQNAMQRCKAAEKGPHDGGAQIGT